MADVSGQADLRGLDIDKIAKGFADEEIVFKKFVNVTPTANREIRWYQKTSGFLDTTDTTGITASNISNVSEGALPFVVQQSWTRNTSYVRKYFVESPMLNDEDIKDADMDILGTNIRDLVRAVAYQVDQRIWNVMTESQSAVNINSTTTTSVGGDQWDAASGLNPIEDIMDAMRQIRVNGYDPLNGGVLFVSPKDHMSLMVYLFNQGAQVPQMAQAVVTEGAVIMTLLGLKVVVSTNVTADYAVVAVPNRAVTWKSFVPITSVTIEDKGIGTKIRVWEEGEAILTDPKAVTLIVDTQT